MTIVGDSNGGTDPRAWYRIGLAHLQAGRLHEARLALEEAQRRGYADAAAPLGTVYRLLGLPVDAEGAYIRVLNRTTQAGLRHVAADELAQLYSDLGSPRAHTAMLQYRAGLDGSSKLPVPRPRVRQLPTGDYIVEDGHRVVVIARRLWRRLPPWGRAIALLLSLVASGLTILEFIHWPI